MRVDSLRSRGNTVYYVRAYAVNSAGAGYGNELSFTTQTPQADTTVIVASDGSGNYTTLQAAFRAVPSNYTGHWIIFVKEGNVLREGYSCQRQNQRDHRG